MYHSGERFVKLVGLYLSLYPKYLGPWDFKAAHSLIPNTTLYSDWFNRETEQVPFLSLPRMSMCKPLPFLLCLHCLITLFLNVSGLPEEGWVLVKLTDFWSCVPKEERIWEWLGTSSPRDTLCEDIDTSPTGAGGDGEARRQRLRWAHRCGQMEGCSLLVSQRSSTIVNEVAHSLCSLNYRCSSSISLYCYLIPLSFNSLVNVLSLPHVVSSRKIGVILRILLNPCL